jgi:hypothetical protein
MIESTVEYIQRCQRNFKEHVERIKVKILPKLALTNIWKTKYRSPQIEMERPVLVRELRNTGLINTFDNSSGIRMS